MKNKFVFIICAIITSIIGFWIGFATTKNFIPNQNTKTQASNTGNPETVAKGVDTTEKPKEVATIVPDGSDVIDTQKDNVPKPLPAPAANGCPKPSKEYKDESDRDVGQDISLEDKDYIPSDLVKLDKSITKYPALCVKKDVADALKSMFDAANKEGYTIIVSSAFRDYDTQKFIVEREKKNGNKNVSVAVAKPGYSEHQLGVAVDFTSKSIAYASAAGKFGDSPEAAWLELHASEYGFMESYPKGKQDITGYMYEPWHYRYVGTENAKEIVKNNQTINQYLKVKSDAEADKNKDQVAG